MTGKVEEYILRRIRENEAIHMTLIDPENETPETAALLAHESELCETSAIMVGGTTLVSSKQLNTVVKAIKKTVRIPIILFPNNITGVSRYADAIWFMSLLNSSDAYFLTGAQVLAAPLIKKFSLEAISLGYIIIGEGGSVGVIGRACPIPYNKPELAVAFSLAAQYFGMHFIYLEAGSGVSRPVPTDMVRMVKVNINTPLIVGGGIRNGSQAEELVKSGADVIITSTVIEESERNLLKNKIEEIVKGIKDGIKARHEI